MSTLFTSNTPDTSSLAAGYFRIGFVVLAIPPEDIVTARSVNNDRIGTLRGLNEQFKKTGQSRWDVTVSWTALQDTGNPEQAYSQWTDLQNIVAIFKAAPFVEVESPHLRQMLAAKDPQMATQRLAMGLRQLRISTHPDIVDALSCTLTMSLFNFLPYSTAFAYQGDNGQPSDASQSQKFKDYIGAWVAVNLNHQARPADPACLPWISQAPGALHLHWRTYLPVHTGQVPSFAGVLSPSTTIGSAGNHVTYTGTARTSTGTLAPDIAAMIDQVARNHGLDPAILKAQCYQESGGNPNAQSGKGAQGLFQIIPSTAASLGVTNPLDPVQSIQGGCQYMAQLLHQFGSYPLALAAYNAGPGAVIAFRDGKSVPTRSGVVINASRICTGGIPPYPETQNYVASILANARLHYGYSGAATPPAPSVPSPAPATAAATPTANSDGMMRTDSATEQVFQATLEELCTKQGWSFDHRSDVGGNGVAFLFKENSLRFAPVDLQDETTFPDIEPTQISVLFVNNLAQIPLDGYQYPTYQHVGPTSSSVQVSFLSKGNRSVAGTDEPLHDGLITLTSMAHNLEQQYQRLRTQFRRVSSIHRMQAVFVENQVLNLLGIYGLMLDQVTTETVAESADLAVAQMTGSQYENIYEEVDAYRLNGVAGTYMNELHTMVFDSSTLQNANPDETGNMKPLLTYQQQAEAGDEKDLNSRLLAEAKRPSSTLFQFMNAATPLPAIGGANRAALLAGALAGSATYPVAFARAEQLSNGQPLTIVDYLMFKEVGYATGSSILSGAGAAVSTGGFGVSGLSSDTIGMSGSLQAAAAAIDPTIPNRQALVKDAYQKLFPYFSVTDPALRSAVNNLISSPAFTSAITGKDPSLENNKHGAYRDMGLTSQMLDGEDFNPGMYFVNDNQAYRERARVHAAAALEDSQDASNQFNAPDGGQAISLSATTSLPGNLDSFMQTVHIPGYTMAEAFPTYKLFFLEDENQGIFYAFDDFYSWASVMDIEVIRYRDKPAVARIVISNQNHLLDHKLFDATLAGKRESQLFKWGLYTGNNSEAVAGGEDAQLYGVGGKLGPGGTPFQYLGPDTTEGYPGGDLTNRRVPLQYFPLQTGTKIQLRMGFSNNPDELTVVFAGIVTEREGSDIVTLTAQSFLLELTTLTADKMDHNSWWHLGAILSSGASLIYPLQWLGAKWGPGPAYGGLTLFGDSGDTGSIIETMLKSSSARHFGHFQINAAAPSRLVKGFSWTDVAGKNISALGAVTGSTTLDNVGSMVQANYDRSGENIMINDVVYFDGSKQDRSSARSIFDDGNTRPWRPYAYYVDSKLPWPVWDLMRDVSRRFPEYILAEKWYGFPYSCDATLVFGHPLDWYYARPHLLGDGEKQRAQDQNGSLFQQWWQSQGQAQFIQMLSTVGAAARPEHSDLTRQASQGPAQMTAVLNKIWQTELGGIGSQDEDINEFFEALPALIAKAVPRFAAVLRESQREINAVAKSYDAYVSAHQAGGTQATDRVRPIRRYHFIDQQSIIHNGLRLNDKIYNGVRIGDGEPNGKSYPISANNNIPAQHMRMLDVTDQINDPKRNVINPTISFGLTDSGKHGLIMAYAQSFLREEVGKMYRGDLVLRGIPEIEPYDVLIMVDPSTSMVGPVEVDTVIQSFNPEMGFTTIVKPRAFVAVNEAASAYYLRALGMVIGNTLPEILRLKDLSGASQVISSLGAGAASLGAAAGAKAALVGAGYLGSAATNVGGAVLANSGALAGLGASDAAIATTAAGALEAGEAIGAAAAFLASPPGWVVLSLCTLAAAGGALWFANQAMGTNPLVVSPLTKFGRPFLGGLEGWSISDLVGQFNNSVQQFMADEIYPTLDLWKAYHHYQDPYLAMPTPLNGPS